MASRGTTFAKQERDRAKKARAAEKRERRAAKAAEEEVGTDAPAPELPAEGEDIPAADLLRLVEELHQAFADKRIDFEEFEERKAELMERIAVE
jgi:hypothetical protein